MRRTTIWLWITGGVLMTAVIAVFGGWWALRQWPDVIGPRLPPSLAYAIAGWGPEEARAAGACFGASTEYWWPHPMTTAQADARNAILCAELRGSRAQQLMVLDFIGSDNFPGGSTGFVDASPERDALVFALTASPDRDLCEKARECWQRNGPGVLTTLRWLSPPDADDRSLLSPDGWTASPIGAWAWEMIMLNSVGYDHKTPNKFHISQKERLNRLMTEAEDGIIAQDPRTHAIGLLAIADALAMTGDPLLKPVVERGLATLLSNPARLERLWLEDTTAAVLTAWAYNTIASCGIATGPLQQALSTGLDTWLATRDESGIPLWFAHGQPVAATVQERWGALIICLIKLHREPTLPSMPLAGIADPRSSTPFGRYLFRLASSLSAGKPSWEHVFDQRTKTLEAQRLIAPDHKPPEGSWPATTAVSSRWETTFALLELCIERYRPPPVWTP